MITTEINFNLQILSHIIRWLGIQLMRYHHIICDLLYIAWNLTKSRYVCFFSGSITSNVTQIHYHSEGKVKRKLQYVPENYLSPFLVARVSEESCWELKCRENRLVTAFKTRQKFHFRDIPFTKLKSHTLQQHLWQPHFRATIGQIAWKPEVEYFQRASCQKKIFLSVFKLGASIMWTRSRRGELWEGGFTFYNLWYVSRQKPPFKTSYVFYAREMILA